jgi:hypothetical protein
MNNDYFKLPNENINMREEDKYGEFEKSLINTFNSLVNKDIPLFTTDADVLWGKYLNNIPSVGRQHYNCNCCRHFIERYGNLAIVNENGELKSVLWTEDVPEFFKNSAKRLKETVEKSRITGVFVSDEKVLGSLKTGIWSHLHVVLPNDMVNRSRVKTDSQLMAEKLEDYRMLNRALQEYSLNTVNKAVDLLNTETLYRADSCLGVAKYFQSLYNDRNKCKSSKVKENITWVYVAKAPTGFTHIKSSMIGTLLDDIEEGLSFETISRNFAIKMGTYMRSQVAPTESGIKQAEKLIEKLNLANSLGRRFPTFDEIPCFLWKDTHFQKQDLKQSSGVFSNVIPKGKTTTTVVNNVNLPTTVMTWEKFQRTVLPTAENIEVKVDNTNRLMALVTALDETSENILQWNNTFSWYYHGGIDGEIKRRVENAGGRYENNEIRCSLIWDGYTDLDLHCNTPLHEHIYFSAKQSRSGGFLDVDANGLDGRTQTPVENIRFSNNAPNGMYEFYVHNYCERGKTGRTSFKVELEINGVIYNYSGELHDCNYDRNIFKFNYIKGQQPIIANSNSTITMNNDWNVKVNDFVKVTGITNSPNLWGDKQITKSGTHVFFLLDGCRDLSEGKGRGFFNEMLKPELHEIRKTLEAYMANSVIEDADKASACGVGYSKDSEWNLTLKVTSNNSIRYIKIDRFD